MNKLQKATLNMKEFDIVTILKKHDFCGYNLFTAEVVDFYINGKALILEYVQINNGKKTNRIDELMILEDTSILIAKGQHDIKLTYTGDRKYNYILDAKNQVNPDSIVYIN